MLVLLNALGRRIYLETCLLNPLRALWHIRPTQEIANRPCFVPSVQSGPKIIHSPSFLVRMIFSICMSAPLRVWQLSFINPVACLISFQKPLTFSSLVLVSVAVILFMWWGYRPHAQPSSFLIHAWDWPWRSLPAVYQYDM